MISHSLSNHMIVIFLSHLFDSLARSPGRRPELLWIACSAAAEHRHSDLPAHCHRAWVLELPHDSRWHRHRLHAVSQRQPEHSTGERCASDSAHTAAQTVSGDQAHQGRPPPTWRWPSADLPHGAGHRPRRHRRQRGLDDGVRDEGHRHVHQRKVRADSLQQHQGETGCGDAESHHSTDALLHPANGAAHQNGLITASALLVTPAATTTASTASAPAKRRGAGAECHPQEGAPPEGEIAKADWKLKGSPPQCSFCAESTQVAVGKAGGEQGGSGRCREPRE